MYFLKIWMVVSITLKQIILDLKLIFEKGVNIGGEINKGKNWWGKNSGEKVVGKKWWGKSGGEKMVGKKWWGKSWWGKDFQLKNFSGETTCGEISWWGNVLVGKGKVGK